MKKKGCGAAAPPTPLAPSDACAERKPVDFHSPPAADQYMYEKKGALTRRHSRGARPNLMQTPTNRLQID
jgi:hypothetical protein